MFKSADSTEPKNETKQCFNLLYNFWTYRQKSASRTENQIKAYRKVKGEPKFIHIKSSEEYSKPQTELNEPKIKTKKKAI